MNQYEQKQEAKRQRYLDLAENHEKRSAGAMKASHAATDGIPFGQPILVGHHSEGRHRAALKRSDNAIRRSIDHDDKAAYYRGKAAGVGKAGISSDDPDAASKLYQKIARAKASQHTMKACNKIVRDKMAGLSEEKAKVARILALQSQGLTADQAEELLKPDFAGRPGFPSYALTNNNANIRRMEKRLEQLRAAPTETTRQKIGEVEIVNNADLNRTQVFFPGKPSAEIRGQLKSHGFRWSRYEGAWQRHLSAQATYQAEAVAAAYGKETPCRDTTSH